MRILQDDKITNYKEITDTLFELGRNESTIEELEEHANDEVLHVVHGKTNKDNKFIISILKESEQVDRKGISRSIRKRLLSDNICTCEEKKQYLYDLCHLVAPRFGGTNKADNLFVGTQRLNQVSMRDAENEIAAYLESSINKGNHVFYSLVLEFNKNDKICSNVKMRAYSIENKGLIVEKEFNNVQPNYHINYADGSACSVDEI